MVKLADEAVDVMQGVGKFDKRNQKIANKAQR